MPQKSATCAFSIFKVFILIALISYNMCMRLIDLVFISINDSAYLIKSKQTLRNKFSILLSYFRLTLKLLILNKIFRIRNEKIFGLQVISFDYRTIHFLFREIFLRNDYFFKTNKKNPLIFDCGAHIGVATFFFKWLYPNSEIHAFEPNKDTFRLLKKNVEQNKLDKVYMYNVALSDKNGKIDFYIDKENLGSGHMSTIFERMPRDKIIVDAVALSTFIKDKGIDYIDFIKMDIEGSEETVILDLIRNNKLQNVKEMVIEYHHNISGKKAKLGQFLKLLEDNGFEYQIDARCIPLYSQGKFQDILIYAYEK